LTNTKESWLLPITKEKKTAHILSGIVSVIGAFSLRLLINHDLKIEFPNEILVDEMSTLKLKEVCRNFQFVLWESCLEAEDVLSLF